MDVDNWRWGLAYDQWVALPVSGSRPAARYKVSCCFDVELRRFFFAL